MQRAAREVDKVTQAEAKRVDVEKRATVATTATRKSVEDLTKGYDAYTKKLKSGTDDHEIAIKQLNRFSQEFDRLAKKTPAGSAAAEDMLRLARNAKTAAKEMEAALKRRTAQIEQSYRQAAEVEQAYKDLDKARRRRRQEGCRRREASTRGQAALLLGDLQRDHRRREETLSRQARHRQSRAGGFRPRPAGASRFRY
jgi:hypothetical protein